MISHLQTQKFICGVLRTRIINGGTDKFLYRRLMYYDYFSCTARKVAIILASGSSDPSSSTAA